jgi:hypothetical protein
MNGKISHLPKSIREQLNRRLDDAERHDRILAWLNSLPEVRALVASDFAGRPVSKQNLHEWARHGFRQWQLRKNASAFATQDLTDGLSAKNCSAASLTEKLVLWVALHFAASAHNLAPAGDEPEVDLHHLQHIAADIIALRRGDLYARRVAIEEKRLALQAAEATEAREDEFWAWTKRRDIREQLEEEFEKQRSWHQTLIAAAPEIAPYLAKKTKPRPGLDETSAPAALI